jgi:hypothetical protein
MPDDVQSMLEQSVNCWEAGDVKSTSGKLTSAIKSMKEKRLDYA